MKRNFEFEMFKESEFANGDTACWPVEPNDPKQIPFGSPAYITHK